MDIILNALLIHLESEHPLL